MDMTKVADGLKNHVLTPAAKGAVQAAFEGVTALASKRGGKTLPIFALIGIGLVIGAGAALMLAPATGKEVRAKLMGLASKLMPSKAKDVVGETEEAQPESAKPEAATVGNSHGRRRGASANATS